MRLTRLMRVFGPEPLASLTKVHAVSTAADACITVSLAGSLFFSVSVDAARPRLALYLILTLAPFAVVAPLIGPATDRFRRPQATFIAFTGQARAILALFIAVDIRGLLLYPEAFAVLVLGQSYSIVKRALVPALVSRDEELVAANARLSRIGSVAGLAGGSVAAALLQLTGTTAVLRLAAVLHLAAAALSFGIPRATVASGTELAPASRSADAARAGVRAPLFSITVLRGASGLVTFLIAFGLKRSGEPLVFFGVVAVAATVASFAGTFVSPILRRHLVNERVMLAACGALAMIAAVVAATLQGRAGMLLATASLALGASAGRNAFDSVVQREFDERDRSRAFARAETTMQLAWVFGALVPTVLNFAIGIGYGVSAALAAAAAVALIPHWRPATRPDLSRR
jgi:hypothetical protein